MTHSEFGAQLKGLVQGLWLPSETEAPWTVPTWTLQDGSAAEIRKILRRKESVPVEEMSLADFMEQVERRCRGYGDEGKAIAQQHQALARFLKDHCQTVRVLRIGEVTIDVLIVGQTANGFAVLQTQSVET